MTQIKTFLINDMEQLEGVINTWLAANDAELHHIMPMPVVRNGVAATMVIVVYSKDKWRG